MKLIPAVALALFAATPAFAASSFLVDFEKNWAYGEAVDNTYAASGVSFLNVLGFSNDGISTGYTNAPSPLGVATVQLDGVINTASYMNVAAGVDNALFFYYSTPGDALGAIKAYSGLNGTGTLLGSFDLTANNAAYDVWTPVTFSFAGTAKSFDLTGSANLVGLDNISAVPEPGSLLLLLAGGAVALRTAARRRT